MQRVISRTWPVVALTAWLALAGAALATPDDATQRVQDLRGQVTTTLARGIADEQVRLAVRARVNAVVEAWTVATLNQDGPVLERGFDALYDEQVTPVLHGPRVSVRSVDVRRLTEQLAEAEIARQTAE